MRAPQLYQFIAIVFLVLFIFNSCKKDITEPELQLPPITQEGLNTFGCLIDGEVWLPDNKGLAIVTDIDCYFGGIRIYVRNRDVDEQITLFADSVISDAICICSTIECDTLSPIPILFELGDIEELGKAGIYDLRDIAFFTSSYNLGSCQITKLDIHNKIISGIFEFDAYIQNDTLTHYEIREGRFDIKF